MAARRVSFVLVWIALCAEMAGDCFGGKWETPLTPISTFLFTPIEGLKFPPWYLAVIATWAWGLTTKGARTGRSSALSTSIYVSLGAIALMVLWGAVTGGDFKQMSWQLHGFLMGFMTALMLMATCHTVEHFVSLGKVFVFATIYRATILLVFWFSVGRDLVPQLVTQTTHADTTLFVSGLLILGINALERRTLRAILAAALAAVPIGLAIRYNNRRLAWLSLLLGMAVVYVMLPKGKLRRRINYAVAVAAPLLVAYVVVGWGRSEGVFKPVHAISTMLGDQQDASAETRNIENYNLVMTLKSNPLLGTGWGHEYQEVSVAYSIKEFFEQYRYIPHNSVLGVLAFGGFVGFTGIWQLFPVSSFLLAHTYRATTDPRVRIATLSAFVGLVVFVLQMWGDMGMGTIPSDVLFGASIAVAARMPVLGAPPKKPSPKPGVDHEDGKDVQGHEGSERDHRLPETVPSDALAGEEQRDREGREENA